MRPGYRRATLLVCSALLAGAIASPATARPENRNQSRQGAMHVQTAPAEISDGIHAVMRADHARKEKTSRPGRRHRAAKRGAKARASLARAPSSGGFSSNDLVATARGYIGTNPTGRRTLWCGAFMDKVLRENGYKGGGNLALAYAKYGRRVSGPKVGAIAVIRRRSGGHVGVVSGLDPNGNPVVISGNHNNTTAESVYQRSRIVAYVMPTK